jgi:single-strand DNA-binding protein
MPNFNKVFLMGNLTRDVELKNTPSNQQVATLGLAVNRRWRTPEGEDREETTFVDCEAWGRTAETLAKYLSKGRPVFLEGRLKLDQWEDKEGKKQSKIRVVVEGFQFIDGPRSGESGGGGGGGGSRGRSGDSEAPARGNRGGGSHVAVSEDDIPF